MIVNPNEPQSNIKSSVLDVYKELMSKALYMHALSTIDIMKSAERKQWIEKYVCEHIIDKKEHYAILGYVYKMGTMVIHENGNETLYPVLHKYKGHDLEETTFFAANGADGVKCGYVEVAKSNIILT